MKCDDVTLTSDYPLLYCKHCLCLFDVQFVFSFCQGSHASWKVLNFFQDLESPEKIYLKIKHFFIGSDGNHFFCSLCLQITCSPLLLNL